MCFEDFAHMMMSLVVSVLILALVMHLPLIEWHCFAVSRHHWLCLIFVGSGLWCLNILQIWWVWLLALWVTVFTCIQVVCVLFRLFVSLQLFVFCPVFGVILGNPIMLAYTCMWSTCTHEHISGQFVVIMWPRLYVQQARKYWLCLNSPLSDWCGHFTPPPPPSPCNRCLLFTSVPSWCPRWTTMTLRQGNESLNELTIENHILFKYYCLLVLYNIYPQPRKF